jgi:ABC-type multidrug transport system fused ATPase/permease subunit
LLITNISFTKIFRITIWSISTLWKVSPGAVLGLTITSIIKELRPLINALVLAAIIDAAIAIADTEGNIEDIYILILAFALISFFLSLVSSIRSYCDLSISNQFRLKGRALVFEKMHQLGVQELENPEVADRVNRVHSEYFLIQQFLNRLLIVTSSIVNGIISGIIVFSFSPILVNGENLNNINTQSWHKHLGVLFQDYNHYGNLSALENIYLGNPIEILDVEKAKEAAHKADALNFIEEYPSGFDQIMSERFTGGIRPSGGQTQKLAIARFFYRNAPLAIFDEPTAAIDAVSEYKIFNQIYDFFRDKTVIIISHRFSTVRNADRIIVLDEGRVVEEGSHDELMSLNGKYAHAFRLQAEGYQDDANLD